MPLLSSTFVTDGNTIAITESVTSGQLLPNTTGQLQCVCLFSGNKSGRVYLQSRKYQRGVRENTTSTTHQERHDISKGQRSNRKNQSRNCHLTPPCDRKLENGLHTFEHNLFNSHIGTT
ncbi:hypothetical protein Aduo_009346 [Ancylostoma duodenale]